MRPGRYGYTRKRFPWGIPFIIILALAAAFCVPYFYYGYHHEKTDTTDLEARVFDLEQVVQIEQPVSRILVPTKPSVVVTNDYYKNGHLLEMSDLNDVKTLPVTGEPIVYNGSHYISDKIGLSGIDLTSIQSRVNESCPMNKFIQIIHQNGSVVCGGETLGQVEYQGTWNAATNTPTLASSVGTKGYYYVVTVAGSTNLNGITDWVIGDWVIFNGVVWEKADHTDNVHSVAGKTGVVVLDAADISSGVFSDSLISNTSVLQYENSINHDNLDGYVASEHIDHNNIYIIPLTGLSGGGQITSSMLINLDINKLPTTTNVNATRDYVPVYNSDSTGIRKVLVGNLRGKVDAQDVSVEQDPGIFYGSNWTDMALMNLTTSNLVATRYQINFNAMWHGITIDSAAWIRINIDGVDIMSSERRVYPFAVNKEAIISATMVTEPLASGVVIKIRCKTTSGIVVIRNRNLNIYGKS